MGENPIQYSFASLLRSRACPLARPFSTGCPPDRENWENLRDHLATSSTPIRQTIHGRVGDSCAEGVVQAKSGGRCECLGECGKSVDAWGYYWCSVPTAEEKNWLACRIRSATALFLCISVRGITVPTGQKHNLLNYWNNIN